MPESPGRKSREAEGSVVQVTTTAVREWGTRFRHRRYRVQGASRRCKEGTVQNGSQNSDKGKGVHSNEGPKDLGGGVSLGKEEKSFLLTHPRLV